MGVRVQKWDLLAIIQLFVYAAGSYYLYKRFLDDHVLVPKWRNMNK